VAEALSALATFYHARGKVSQAQTLYERAVKVWDEAFGVRIHTHLGAALFQLSEIYGFGIRLLQRRSGFAGSLMCVRVCAVLRLRRSRLKKHGAAHMMCGASVCASSGR
jgi:hypothetical protein